MKIRRSHNRLIFIIEMSIPGKTIFKLRRAPGFICSGMPSSRITDVWNTQKRLERNQCSLWYTYIEDGSGMVRAWQYQNIEWLRNKLWNKYFTRVDFDQASMSQWIYQFIIKIIMMTSSNRNIFRVTGHLCGKFIGHQWILRTKTSDAELWCFLWPAPE